MAWITKGSRNAYHRAYWQKNRVKMIEILKKSRDKKNPTRKRIPQRANKTEPEFSTVENELIHLQERFIALRKRYAIKFRKYRNSEYWREIKSAKPRRRKKKC